MALTSTRTVMSDGGKAAKPKYNDEVLKKIAEELERTHSAARNAAQKPQSPNPAFASAERNKPTAPFGDTDPRTRTAFAQKPQNPTPAFASAERNKPSAPFGDTDPRTRTAFAQKPQSPNPAFASTEKSIIQKYSTKSDAYRNQGSGMAALFGETPKKLKNTSADGFIKTKGAGIAAVAGKKTDEATKELLSLLSGDYSPAPAAKDRYEKNGGVADAAGGKTYDWVKDVKDFFDKPGSFSTPNIRDKTMRGEKILNKPKYDEAYYNSDNKMAFVPRVREQQKFDESFMETYNEAERLLNQEEFDSNLECLMVADLNRFRAMPAKITSDVLNMAADCIDELTGEEKNAFCDWLRSMENNSEILEKSEKQYSQVAYDNEFIKEFVIGTHKELVDTASQAFMGGILKIPPKSLSSIYAATEIYNAAREKGYSVEEAMYESGAIAIVNESVNFALDSLGNSISDERIKSVLEVLADTTTETASDMWFETNGEKGSLSLEGIANTLAVEATVELIVKGCKEIGSLIM